MRLISLLEGSEARRWLEGECGTFAYALHQRFGWQMQAIVERSVGEIIWPLAEDYDVVHAFCVVDNQAVDASGFHKIPEVTDFGWEVGDGRELAIVSLTPDELSENRGHLEDVEDTEDALAYIEKNSGLFTSKDN